MHTNPVPPAASARPRRAALALVATAVAATAAVLVGPAPASAALLPQTTGLVSRSDAHTPANAATDGPAISDDGRFVAFTSAATNLVPDDTNGKPDVFVKDRWSQKIERVSVTGAEMQIQGSSDNAAISDDGRYVAFRSNGTNRLTGDDEIRWEAYVRDRVTGDTIRVAPGTGGAQLNADVSDVAISGNGRYIALTTSASNVISGDTNGDTDIFVRDRTTSTVERVSISFIEGQADGNSANPTLSDDGRYVAFDSSALLAGGQIGVGNVYVRDRTGGTTILVDVNSDEAVANDGGGNAMISGNGRYVTFGSNATNLVANDTNAVGDVFRRDLQAGVTSRASLADNDTQLTKASFGSIISDDGSKVGFIGRGTATAATDAGSDDDLFIRDINTASTTRASVSTTVPDPADSVLPAATLSGNGLTATFVHPLALTPDNKTFQTYVNDRPSLGPLSVANQFIDQQFQDFLGRQPNIEERALWNQGFARGYATPPTLIAALASDPAFAGKRAPVVRLYWAFFLRKPDASGLSYWITKYQNGATLSSIAQKFAQSSEFKNRYGTLTNQAYVKKIYPNVFNRQPDPSGLTYWTGKLDRKETTRGGVLTGFSESSEGVRRLAPQVNITLISQGMLRVSPSAAYWDAAFAAYQGGEKELAWLAQNTLDSNAYGDRIAD